MLVSVVAVILLGSLGSGLSLIEKVKWPASTFVDLECLPGENYESCYKSCMTWGPNQTLDFYQRNCYTQVPSDTSMKITRHRFYTPKVNATYIKSESWQIATMEGLKIAMSLDFNKDLPYIDRPEIIKQVLIRGVNLTNAAHQGSPFNIYFSDGLEIPLRADGEYTLQKAISDDTDYRTQCYIPHMEFPWIQKKKYDNERHSIAFIDITEPAANLNRSFPPVILLSGTFVLYSMDEFRNYASALHYILEIIEQQTIKSDPVCTQIKDCQKCLDVDGCGWCLLTNSTYACLETCQHPWTVNECRPVRMSRLLPSRES